MRLTRFASRCLTSRSRIFAIRGSDFEEVIRRDEVAEWFCRAEAIVPNRHFLHKKPVPGFCRNLRIDTNSTARPYSGTNVHDVTREYERTSNVRPSRGIESDISLHEARLEASFYRGETVYKQRNRGGIAFLHHRYQSSVSLSRHSQISA
jgi:hypothetical protein